MFSSQKTGKIGLPYSKESTVWWYVKQFRYNTGAWRTDGQTDGQNCYINIARQLLGNVQIFTNLIHEIKTPLSCLDSVQEALTCYTNDTMFKLITRDYL